MTESFVEALADDLRRMGVMGEEYKSTRDGITSYAKMPDENYDAANDVNPVCGCHIRSRCLGCGVCTSCDGCYCDEE